MARPLDRFARLLDCDTEKKLQRQISRCALSAGFECWTYTVSLSASTRAPYVLSEEPRSGISDHLQLLCRSNEPMMAHCRQHATPLVWTAEPAIEGTDGTPPCRLLEDATGSGLQAIIGVPVHGLGCRWGVVVVATYHPLKRREVVSRLPQVQLLATYVHEAGHRYAAEMTRDDQIHLTVREIECLRWTSLGKTGWEISRLLSISERTVVFHLENASHKLGVFSRHQAVARAIALDLLQPSDPLTAPVLPGYNRDLAPG
ncbi:helix-turn-helix transcriptional regulator [Dokdonella koreensis]|uniref:Transcriptional regulator, LysR family n=1 Tax=Dokdonella koreensis DS-123 TaxID=1300342 RepID=A0A160DZ29_9GAMM|nr:LuxR C-terminal-related transcriptional regulator [Dokdonella koreensis]ANB19433.1 Transcriptional regulator, LysR family [Dokdonella koreensis DS-123]